ncbi:PAS domain-containing protein [Flavobacteriaceae bacterium TP-CH-4]|uniref:histidine kinase n=1 Tax=Pelagihabitans pacificus TaxID=2696054 RepID=A0A967AT93_9FLAO|nr:PAS domain-containing protein [Pelagihabitans pacificus]NHF58795.1 PAS domain-containing protein [Pelagihabitans pacificus]
MKTLTTNFLIKDSPMAVAIFDTQMCFISHSDIWSIKFGQGRQTLQGKSLYDIAPNTPKTLRQIHVDCLAGASNSNNGQKFIHPDGTVQWLKWKMKPWRDEEDRIGGLIMVQEDITEEKLKEELLLKAKSVARIGGWEVDMTSNKVYWTQITREIHEVPEDYEPNLEEGINFYKEGWHRNEITRLVTEAMTQGTPWDTELIIITATGREVWVRAKGEAETINGKCVRIYGTFQDIDEKKRMQLEYQTVSDRLAIATHAAKIGIWDYDIVHNNLVWDDNMYKLYGIKPSDFGGVVEAWEAAVHPDDKERSQKGVEMAIAGVQEFNAEFRVIWPNGEIRYIKAESTVRRDTNGNPVRMVGANWDITEDKRAEKKLKNLLDITSEQNNSLLNFAHIVSHNLRSHSSNLSMLSGFLSQEEDENERKNLLDMLGNATESLNETVLHLNEVVQVKTGAIDKMKSVNLLDTISGVQKNLALLLKEKEVTVKVKVAKEMTVNAIPAYLDSILLNLFTNSIKYSSPKRPPVISVKAENEEDGKLVVTFSDNGLGIDLERHGKKLFGMYKTFHKHKDAKGIGLFITKNQMEAMNGQIEVTSAVGVGTNFRLYFQQT